MGSIHVVASVRAFFLSMAEGCSMSGGTTSVIFRHHLWVDIWVISTFWLL